MKRFKTPDKPDQNWGRILKEQNPTKLDQKKTTLSTNSSKQKIQLNSSRVQLHQFSVKNVPQSKSVKFLSNNKPVPAKESIKKLEKVSSHTPTTNRKKQSLSSNSDLSLSGDSVELVDCGVQYSTSNLENFDPVNVEGLNNGLAIFNPVRTLNFLIRELRGKISESSQDENMARIISDMENTVMRITKSNSAKENFGSLICKDDLQCFLNILQRSEKDSDVDKGTAELQKKLEDTCSKLEEMCRVMEKTANYKHKEEKQNLISELNKTKEKLQAADKELRRMEKVDEELRKEKQNNEDTKRKVHEMKVKFSTLNSVLNEQLQEMKNENKRLHKEAKFLFLEKEKNTILMKVKDEEIAKLRGSLEEIKDLLKEQLTSFHVDNNIDVPEHDMTLKPSECNLLNNMSVMTWSDGNLNKAMRCSSPVTSCSPAAEDDESWRRISQVASDLRPVEEKTAGIKNLRLSHSAQNLSAFGEPCKVSNKWMDKLDCDMKMHTLTDTESN